MPAIPRQTPPIAGNPDGTAGWPLDEFDATEWFNIGRTFRPQMTREEFDRDWAEFHEIKHRRGLN